MTFDPRGSQPRTARQPVRTWAEPKSAPEPHDHDHDDDGDELQYGVLASCGRVARIIAYCLLPIILLSGFALIAVFVRLSHGEMSVSFLVPPIERGINAELHDRQIAIDDAVLTIAEDGDLELRLKKISLKEPSGEEVATAPLAAVEISTAALWSLRIVPSRIELVRPRIGIVYTEGGGIDLTIDKQPEPTEEEAAQEQAEAAKPKTSDEPAAAAKQGVDAAPGEVSRVVLPNLFRTMSKRARARMDATSYITEIGLRDAVLTLEHKGARTELSVPIFSVDLEHARQRSVVLAQARVASDRGSWTVQLETEELEANDQLTLKTQIRDLIPASLSMTLPPLAPLSIFDMPVAIDTTFTLAADGSIANGGATIEVGAGPVRLPGLANEPVMISGGLFEAAYDAAQKQIELKPSPIRWGGSQIIFSGRAQSHGQDGWAFAIDGRDGVFTAEDLNGESVKLDTWRAAGLFAAEKGAIRLDEFLIAGGGTQVRFAGQAVSGPKGWSADFAGELGAMELPVAKALWPKALAPGARSWVGERVHGGQISSGKVSFTSGIFYTETQAPAATPQTVSGDGMMSGLGSGLGAASTARERLSASIELADVTFAPIEGVAPLKAPRGLIRIENNGLEIAVPEATVLLAPDSKVVLKAGRMTSPNLSTTRPESQIAFSIHSPLGQALQLIKQLPLKSTDKDQDVPAGIDGKFSADVTVALPLVSNLFLSEVAVRGEGKITDGKLGKIGSKYDVQGIKAGLIFTEQALEAAGDALVNGVSVKVAAHRQFQLAPEQQPPVTINARIDDADRKQLGLDINDIVRGVTTVDLAVAKTINGENQIAITADLTEAELMLDAIAWRKPHGRQAKLAVDIVPGRDGGTILQNLKVTGEELGIQGWIGLGGNNKLKEFHFEAFNLSLLSRLEVQGTVGSGGVWNVIARGPNFDGRDFFRSLFSVGEAEAKGSTKSNSPGVDLTVKVDNVMGFSDIYLRGLALELSTRGGKLTRLTANGRLDGGAKIAAVLDPQNRKLFVESNDAGQVMKLIDFYPNMQGGLVRLEVALDGRGEAEKTGMLAVDRFRILGDQVVSEVVQSADGSRSGSQRNERGQTQTRQVFDFDTMRVPFSVGFGQFVMSDSFLRGPVMGATIRGTVDFKMRRVNAGGTYIPLQGLNNVLGGIPVLGQILSGTRSEGIFGITFAIRGSLANPEVIVNPLSLVAPGIFREMFQMTAPDPRVQPRESNTAPESSVRSSSAPAETGGRRSGTSAGQRSSDIIDGWTSETTTQKPSRRQ